MSFVNHDRSYTTCIRVGFMVDKVALGQVFSEFFCFPCPYHSTFVLHTHISSGGWTDSSET
jgi:hypothetical protein